MKLKNIFNLKSQRSIMAAVFFASLSIYSCKKEESNIGLLVQPPEDAINGIVTDTFSLVTYSRLDDSIQTDEASTNLLGSIVDPVFGKTTAGFYTQVRLAANNPVFDVPNTTVDSIVLTLVYGGSYGKADQQTFQVFQLSNQLYIDSNYYSNSVVADNGIDLVDASSATQIPDFNHSFYDPILKDSVRPHLRLRLNNSLAQDIINQSGTGNLNDNTAFSSWFKGLRVAVNNPAQAPGSGAVININMLDADTKLTIYYHTPTDTLGFQLLINEFAARYTTFSHDYTGTPVQTVLNDSTAGMNSFFIQSGAGLVGEIQFPTLTNLKQSGNIVVNYAELVIPVQFYTPDPLVPVSGIIINGIDQEGKLYSIKDLTSLVTFGGSYDALNKNYRFVITRHIQDLISGNRPNLGIRLLPQASAVTINRTVLSGMNSTGRAKPYLKVIYTKY